ncbi:hypothetical protein ACJX0J_038771, partial [Zea mays]
LLYIERLEDVVASLASHKNVWDAVMKNVKLYQWSAFWACCRERTFSPDSQTGHKASSQANLDIDFHQYIYIYVRNMLDDMLEKNLEIVKAPCLNLVDPMETGGGIKLFKKAPPGISMDSTDKWHVQLKRPRIVPGEEVDEKSKKFRHMLRSVVVDGSDIVVSAKKASERSLARLEVREAAAKAKAKREEERVQELKKVRGEKWLPSVARQMK